MYFFSCFAGAWGMLFSRSGIAHSCPIEEDIPADCAGNPGSFCGGYVRDNMLKTCILEWYCLVNSMLIVC